MYTDRKKIELLLVGTLCVASLAGNKNLNVLIIMIIWKRAMGKNIEKLTKTDARARLTRRSALARLDQVERVTRCEKNTLVRGSDSIRHTQLQQQASTPEWCHLHTQPNPAAIRLGHTWALLFPLLFARSCSLTTL